MYLENEKQKHYQKQCAIAYYILIYLIGSLNGCLGPSIPIMSEQLEQPIYTFAKLFSFRGLGSIVGSLLSAKFQQHYFYSLASTILGISSIFVSYFESIESLCIIFFFFGMGSSIIEILSNVLIVWTFGDKVDPWMQGMHFCYGIGVMVSPVLIAWFGYKFTYFFFGFLCWLMCFYLDKLQTPDQEQQQQVQNNQSVQQIQDSDKEEQLLQENQQLINIPKSFLYTISIFFYFYGGLETSFGGWIPSYTVLKQLVQNENSAAYGTTMYWSAIAIGRLLAIPLSIKFHKFTLLSIDLYGCLFSCFFMLIFQEGLVFVYLGEIMLGIFMASIFPCAFSIPTYFNMKISGEYGSMITIFGGIGEVTIPFIYGQFFDFFGPNSFLWTNLLMSITLIILYFNIMKYDSNHLKKSQLQQHSSMNSKIQQIQ